MAKMRCKDENCGHIHEVLDEAAPKLKQKAGKYQCPDPLCDHGHDKPFNAPKKAIPVKDPQCVFKDGTPCRLPDKWLVRFEKEPLPPEKEICNLCLKAID